MFYCLSVKRISGLLFFILSSTIIYAQQTNPAYKPTKEEILERYKKAAFSDSTINRGKIFNLTVQPVWLEDGKEFWYRRAFKDSVREYILVNAVTGKKQPLFNHAKLADALSKKTARSINPQKLLISNVKFDKRNNILGFEMDNKFWNCNLKTYACVDTATATSTEAQTTPWWRRNMRRSRWWGYKTDSISPNKQMVAYIQNGNVFIQSVNGGEAVQFTTDGTEAKPYGSLAWSPDSKYIIGYKIIPYKDSLVYYVSTSQPNTTRGQLQSQEYKQPGDPFTTYEMFSFSVADKKTTRINTDIIDFFPAPYLNWRKESPDHFFIRKSRSGAPTFQNYRCEC